MTCNAEFDIEEQQDEEGNRVELLVYGGDTDAPVAAIAYAAYRIASGVAHLQSANDCELVLIYFGQDPEVTVGDWHALADEERAWRCRGLEFYEVTLNLLRSLVQASDALRMVGIRLADNPAVGLVDSHFLRVVGATAASTARALVETYELCGSMAEIEGEDDSEDGADPNSED